jgi:hypothetical protein
MRKGAQLLAASEAVRRLVVSLGLPPRTATLPVKASSVLLER